VTKDDRTGKMIGKTLSHYRILEKLGEGGMGVVYKAEDTRLKRNVALKFLNPQTIGTDEDKARFTHEAQAAAALNHPNICTIYEIDEADGRLFIAMELIKGRSLKEKIAEGPIRLDEVLDISIQVAEGLNSAHMQGIVHRDIKPANIMAAPGGQVKIMDFGLAKTRGRTRLTQTGSTLGTVSYMSPEQARGAEVDDRTDLWSLGVVLYEMLTGRLPFGGDHEQAVIYSILNKEPEPVTALRTGVPKELERIVLKALAKSPNERYQHMDELLVDLRSFKKMASTPKRAIRTSVTRQPVLRRAYLYVGLVVLIVLLVLSRFDFFAGDRETIDSIAVLPLENLSQDPGKEYFADGMTEAIIADLAKIGALRVISRTSVMRYKGTNKSLPRIGEELHVDAIVEGSVLLAGDRVRITTQLIEAAADRHLWAESYERDLRDVLGLQRDVAQAIAHEIKIKLTSKEQVVLESANQIDPEAYDAYLKGRFHWNKRTKQDLEKSIKYFEQAAEKEPDYALAYAGLADAYIVIADWGFSPPIEARRKAKLYAQRALSLDNSLVEARTSLAALAASLDWDLEKSEEGYKRAIESNPNYATAHQWYAELLMVTGRFDEALSEIRTALELDPFSLVMHHVRGAVYYYSRDFDDAIREYETILELDKDFSPARYFLSYCYCQKKMYKEAVEEYKKALIIDGTGMEKVESLEQAFEKNGGKGFNLWITKELDETTDQEYNVPYYYAEAYARMGEIDKAIEWLEKSYEVGSVNTMYMAVSPDFDSIRSDARFKNLMHKVGLPEISREDKR
jgi:serine/threonine protein kinase/tetratricopeptide (TPR) repeat protein